MIEVARRPALRASALLVAALLAVALAPALFAQGLYLHVLPVSAPEGLPTAGDWAVALQFNDTEAALGGLAATLPATAEPVPTEPATEPRRVWFRVTESMTLGGEVETRHRKSSFVVDFHEPSVVSVGEAFLGDMDTSQLTKQPSIEALVTLADDTIVDKNYGRGWDLASRVARHGEGDCSEHAVLLAALARFFGYPSRVVIGLALVIKDESGDVEVKDTEAAEDATEIAEELPPFSAFGHAWAEIYVDGRWLLTDATRPQDEPGVKVRWLPLLELDNEGPGYGLAAGMMVQLLPKKVELLATEPATVTELWQAQQN